MTKSAGRKVFLPVIITVWLFAIGVGLRFVLAYENTPGTVGGVPRVWPLESGLQRSTKLPTLVMMVHPQCPCSRASIGELAVLLEGRTDLVNAQVVFVRPWEFGDEWEKTELWNKTESIHGVKLSVDPGGAEARRFGSQTSGQVLLYSSQGQLLFSGGITDSRGHAGESEGRTAIVALLTQGQPASDVTPVFGCPLFGKGSKQEEEFCNASRRN
ncbi:MAG TPA: hypothetical protein VGO56_11005 [Pyrinomonadaceae bacterium]|jgi:hypothetical protein|nr:hypothetical protein [Pyrinomonadaceae bacterium]